MVFHNGSTYDCKFIIKEFGKELEDQFECLGENTEKYITSSVPIKKEFDNGKTITYKIKFIDSFRFIAHYQVLLIVYQRVFITQNIKNKIHIVTLKELKMQNYVLNVLIMERKYEKAFKKNSVKNLIKNVSNTYDYCNGDINKSILLLRKGVYPSEYMDSWERFDDKLLPKKTFLQ